MHIFDSIAGTVRIELVSADITGSLHAINEMRVPIYDLEFTGELGARFTIPKGCFKQIEETANRKGERIALLSQKGIYPIICRLMQRRILLFGFAALFFLTSFLPSRVLFLKVEGNKTVPSRMILEAAKEAGIDFWASRRAVRSEKMKNALLKELPQLQWTGVNTYGCTAVISVRERNAEAHRIDDFGVSRIVAACDGIITSCTVTGGTATCNVGEAVQKDQILISGYTDCGGVIMAERATGEIFAQTSHKIYAVTPLERKIRSEYEHARTNFCLRIGKKRINFFKGSGISDSTCVKMVTEYKLALPGGNELPLALIKEQYLSCDLTDKRIDDQAVTARLSEFSRGLLSLSSVALTVTDAQEAIEVAGGLVVLNGLYSCTEMIGREQSEQIGDYYGKTG